MSKRNKFYIWSVRNRYVMRSKNSPCRNALREVTDYINEKKQQGIIWDVDYGIHLDPIPLGGSVGHANFDSHVKTVDKLLRPEIIKMLTCSWEWRGKRERGIVRHTWKNDLISLVLPARLVYSVTIEVFNRII